MLHKIALSAKQTCFHLAVFANKSVSTIHCIQLPGACCQQQFQFFGWVYLFNSCKFMYFSKFFTQNNLIYVHIGFYGQYTHWFGYFKHKFTLKSLKFLWRCPWLGGHVTPGYRNGLKPVALGSAVNVSQTNDEVQLLRSVYWQEKINPFNFIMRMFMVTWCFKQSLFVVNSYQQNVFAETYIFANQFL